MESCEALSCEARRSWPTLAKTDFGQNECDLLCVVCGVLCVAWVLHGFMEWGLGPPGLHTTTRELQTCTFQGPGASITPPKFHEKTPEREKN